VSLCPLGSFEYSTKQCRASEPQSDLLRQIIIFDPLGALVAVSLVTGFNTGQSVPSSAVRPKRQSIENPLWPSRVFLVTLWTANMSSPSLMENGSRCCRPLNQWVTLGETLLSSS